MLSHRATSSFLQSQVVSTPCTVECMPVSQKSMVSHREVGVDTRNGHHALKNTLRQTPDVILIGELRDNETLEHAIAFAETGRLCLGTLHPNSASQTIERILQGDLSAIKGIMTRSRELGMRTVDWALIALCNPGLISFDKALRNADSANELRLNIKLKSGRG